jgi:hypothetical protein
LGRAKAPTVTAAIEIAEVFAVVVHPVLLATEEPLQLKTVMTGSGSGFITPKLLSTGPSPRIKTALGAFPSITKPPIRVCVLLTYPRVDTFTNTAGEEVDARMVPPLPTTTKRCNEGEKAALRSVAELSDDGLSPEKRWIQFTPSIELKIVPCSPAATK